MIAAADGGFYAGTGNDGQVLQDRCVRQVERVLRCRRARGARTGHRAPTAALRRHLPRRQASTGSTRRGGSSVFFDPPDKYIWSLAVDRSGNVFAATGDKGVIYKITPRWKGRAVLPDEGHPRDDARVRSRRAPASPAPSHRAASSRSTRRASRSSCSTPDTTRSISFASMPDGSIFAAAVRGRNAAPAARQRRHDSATPAGADADGDRQRLHRDHGDRHRRFVAGHESRRAARASPVGPGAGAIFRIDTDGASDTIWESRDDTPYDIAFEGRARRAGGHRQEGQDLSAVRRPVSTHPRHTGQRRTGDDAGDGSQRPDESVRHVEPGQDLPARRRTGGTRHLMSRTCATRRRSPHGARCDGSAMTALRHARRNLHPIRQHKNRRRNLERLELRLRRSRKDTQISSPRARYLQWRAVLMASRDTVPLAHVGDRRLPAPQSPAARVSITIHPPGTVFQRQFPVDPEIAGFEGDTPDRRALARPRRHPPAYRSDAAPIRKGC